MKQSDVQSTEALESLEVMLKQFLRVYCLPRIEVDSYFTELTVQVFKSHMDLVKSFTPA